MSTFKTQRLREELVRLCHRGLDAAELVRRATDALRSAIRFDRSCWHTIDPATLMFTGAIKDRFVADPRFPRYEYSIDDFNKFAFLARQRRPVGILGQVTGGMPDQSPRYRDLLAPLGVRDELRVSFVVDDSCWGGCALYRSTDSPAFTDDDASLMAQLSPILAEGLRRAVLVRSGADDSADDAPGLVLLDAHDGIRSITPAAERLLCGLVEVGIPSPGRLPAVVYAVAAQARIAAYAVNESPVVARARARTTAGEWRVLHGTQLTDASDETTAVIIERGRPAEIAPLIVQAYGLSSRERQVTQLAVHGLATDEIAERLGVSPLTVQDYLKAIFRKVEVHSRKELVARIFVDHYEPRLKAAARAGS
jgi:DNA-binding CsgD family transcriptional regulator